MICPCMIVISVVYSTVSMMAPCDCDALDCYLGDILNNCDTVSDICCGLDDCDVMAVAFSMSMLGLRTYVFSDSGV
jgi:hypothetical protein